jgi:hypothetical protein
MQKWEIKRLYIPTILSIDKESKLLSTDHYRIPVWGDSSNEMWSEAEVLASEGWEPVGISQVITGHEHYQETISCGSSNTAGYTLIFKRPLL